MCESCFAFALSVSVTKDSCICRNVAQAETLKADNDYCKCTVTADKPAEIVWLLLLPDSTPNAHTVAILYYLFIYYCCEQTVADVLFVIIYSNSAL